MVARAWFLVSRRRSMSVVPMSPQPDGTMFWFRWNRLSGS